VSDAPIRIGVSACLLGQEVRYDGGHKRDPFLVKTFGRYVEWVHVCPEVEIGLGTPRDPIRLERDGKDVRLVNPKTGTDLTRKMRTYAARRLAALEDLRRSGRWSKEDLVRPLYDLLPGFRHQETHRSLDARM
jgi:uncharacterized protein YbbK (DUF523 family)